MNIKCVFRCDSKGVEPFPGAGAQVTLSPRYSDDNGNRFLNDYATATPSGSLSMYVNNPPALAAFEVGAYYDIALIKRDAPVAEDATPAPTV